MKRSYLLSAILLGTLSLSGCNLMGWSNTSPYTYHSPLYNDSYYNPRIPGPLNDSQPGVNGHRPYAQGFQAVPDSNQYAGKIAPEHHKSLDSNWVNSQNPQGYTIELAHGEKPGEVAKQLTDTPKLERTAQVKYEKDGKTYYRGVYGSYPSREAAEAALKKLPSDIRNKADINQWNNVQSHATQPTVN
jgi:SPOR domain